MRCIQLPERLSSEWEFVAVKSVEHKQINSVLLASQLMKKCLDRGVIGMIELDRYPAAALSGKRVGGVFNSAWNDECRWKRDSLSVT